MVKRVWTELKRQKSVRKVGPGGIPNRRTGKEGVAQRASEQAHWIFAEACLSPWMLTGACVR